MRKLALVTAAFGMLAFVGTARADRKTENTEKTDSSTTLTGKTKTTKNKKIERADGSSMEQKVETTRPKPGDRDAVENARDNDRDQVKREEKTTLTGKKELKTTRKAVAPDGTKTETTTTTTGPDRDHDNK